MTALWNADIHVIRRKWANSGHDKKKKATAMSGFCV
jgi:hypothetical protein